MPSRLMSPQCLPGIVALVALSAHAAHPTAQVTAPPLDVPATRRIDARGLVVAPGFIDPHVHARERIFELPDAEGYLRQGLTTRTTDSEGIRYMLVNGQVTIDQGRHTGLRAGRVLRGAGAR